MPLLVARVMVGLPANSRYADRAKEGAMSVTSVMRMVAVVEAAGAPAMLRPSQAGGVSSW